MGREKEGFRGGSQAQPSSPETHTFATRQQTSKGKGCITFKLNKEDGANTMDRMEKRWQRRQGCNNQTPTAPKFMLGFQMIGFFGTPTIPSQFASRAVLLFPSSRGHHHRIRRTQIMGVSLSN